MKVSAGEWSCSTLDERDMIPTGTNESNELAKLHSVKANTKNPIFVSPIYDLRRKYKKDYTAKLLIELFEGAFLP